MGLILNNNVEETKIMSAYGLTVYGKINRYVWTLSGNTEENALITIRIADAERQRMEEAQKKEGAAVDSIKAYCKEKGLFYYIGYNEVVLIKATNNNDRKMIAEAQRKDDTEKLKMIVEFIGKYPDNNNLKVVFSGNMEEVLQYIA